MDSMQRPPMPRINRNHSLANGMVFGNFGGGASTNLYVDSSGYDNNGVLTNMTAATDWLWSSELGRWCVDFDGTNDEILKTSPNWQCTLPSSMAWWMNSRTLVGYRYVMSCGAGATSFFSVAFDISGVFYYYQNSGARTLTYTSVLNTWEHHAICFDSTTVVRYYVNGVSKTVAQPSGAWGTVTPSLKIGSYGGNYFYNGQLADTLFCNRALSTAEIQILANRSDPMLGGLILPPRRRLWAVPAAATGNRRRRVICGAQ